MSNSNERQRKFLALKPFALDGNEGTLLLLYIQPGAKISSWRGSHGDRIKMSIQAPPIDGEANEALIRFLAKEFHLRQKEIIIQSGHTSRQKNIFIPMNINKVSEILKHLR
jgi:uncharacterized protein (TIGR00251 family)